MQLCTDCKHYQEGATENEDLCMHDKAQRGGVRSVTQYPAFAMRAGLCFNAALFEPKVPVVLEQEVGVEQPTKGTL